MNKLISSSCSILCILVLSIIFSACGGSNDSIENEKKNAFYRIAYNGNNMAPEIEWTLPLDPYITLEFSESIPKGSEWFLDCDASWVKLRNTHGKINSTKLNVGIKVEDNENYKDREANIHIEVPEGMIMPLNSTTLTIHQYGYETHLERGKSVSIVTDLSKAESSTLKITSLRVIEIMEVDWGDGSKEIYTKKNNNSDNLTISHDYNNIRTHNVNLRFAPQEKRQYFTFVIRKGQGVKRVSCGNDVYGFDNSDNIIVTYTENRFSAKYF